MVKLPRQLMDMLSDPVAVMDKNGEVVYANSAFQRLYNPFHDPSRKTPCRELQNLNLRFLRSGEVFTSERVLVRPIGKKFEVFVYSLDRRKQAQVLNLVLVKIEDHRKETEFTIADELVNSYINEQKILSQRLTREFRDLKGEDPAFKMALINARKASRTDLPILIIGESGTGKELLARAIHRASSRGKMPFVDINSATLPDNLIESELFGYERGAFTGARREGKRGLFDQAHKGSVFMDEIGDASPQTQAKILRVLQEWQFKRIGGSRNIRVDVRLISATNKDLSALIAEGKFREDLFYRLNTITINLPPLRERRTDIPLLVNHFLMEYARSERRELRFSPDSMELMESYEWPGNVRELKGVVDYAATMATGSLLTPDSLPSFLYAQDKPRRKKNRQSDLPYFMAAGRKSLLATVLRQVERNLIKKVLERSRTKTEAIQILGISRRTFYAKIKEYNLE
ncbi:MAG: sigma 54-interacting transcriptional regulator [Deltaproteobacteria bacterium]|nr:sigma 54-interacting transcriptional regulator [Deltaproteobacteria bacterium]